jgi:release factor glutamine methyltransferase
VTVRTALEQGHKLLEEAAVGAPRLTAEVLLLHAISANQSCDRAWLYAHSSDELREVWWIHYGRYLHERMQGRPTQYITGRQEFYGREFRVTPDVLIPRSETEHVIEASLPRVAAASRILDIGVGSGGIAITLALETKAHVFATDVSKAALRVAAENARRWGADISLVACDLGSALAYGSFDMVVSNPPYVPARDRERLQREVRDFEPNIALFGGEEGLDVYRRLIPEAWRLLKPGGWLIMELGYDSSGPVREMLGAWRNIEVVKDLAGIARVIAARKPI